MIADEMNRRGLVLSGVVVLVFGAVPRWVHAQPARVYRVGVVLHGGPYAGAVDGLRVGLRELGLEDGRQVVLDVRDCKGDVRQVAAEATSLEAANVDLIVAVTTSVTQAVMRVTQRVPIVFYAGTDPVTAGLVESFRRPGGRLTGIHRQSTDLTAKRLELLKEMMPKARRVATFYRADNPIAQEALQIARTAARRLGLVLVERPVTSVDELAVGLRRMQPGEADAILSISDAMITSQTEMIIAMATAKRLPTMLQETGSVASGALAAYGESYEEVGRLSAKPVHRVLLGAHPGDLPVEQVSRLHLVINLRAAKALGITLPKSILVRADEVIQ